MRLHSPYYLDISSGYQYPDILHSEGASALICLFGFLVILRVRLHSPYYLDNLSGYQYPDILHSEFTKFTI